MSVGDSSCILLPSKQEQNEFYSEDSENSNSMSERKSGSFPKKNTYEMELLESLVEKFGLNDLPKFEPNRSFVWKQIAEEFNLNTGQNYDGKSLSKKYLNFTHYRRKKLLQNVEYSTDGEILPAYEKREYLGMYTASKNSLREPFCMVMQNNPNLQLCRSGKGKRM